MRRGLLVGAALLVSACATANRPTADDPTPWPRPAKPKAAGSRAASASLPSPKYLPASAKEELFSLQRRKAYEPRRFKALYRGEISQKVGVAMRGYLSIFWDGDSLLWKTSAPVAGEGQAGHLSLSGWGGAEKAPFPGRVTPRDAIGALLGTPDLAPQGVNEKGEIVLGEGRFAEIDANGRPVKLTLPDGIVVSLVPGDGVPRRLEATGPDGRAVLTLESYGPWPADK